ILGARLSEFLWRDCPPDNVERSVNRPKFSSWKNLFIACSPFPRNGPSRGEERNTMELKLLRSPGLRATVLVFVLLAAGFVFLTTPAAAQGGRTELVIGLQNDMTTLDYFNPETNTVWNAYQVGYSFEGLFSNDPDYSVFATLANPAKGTSGPGFTFIVPPTSPQPVVDVYIRPGVTFHDGSSMTRDDVVFSYQVLEWSTYQTFISSALWWDAPIWPHWTGGSAVSHVGVEPSPAASDAVRFHLSKPYALFFLGTLQVPIIPKSIWTNHINTAQRPINITSLQPITDSDDYSADFSFGNTATQTASTIGTGMFKFDSWSPKSGSHISVYDGYWGKGVSVSWRGVSYPLFPESLRSIKFVIFTSLDVISLALQKGEVDTLIWSLTPGFLTQVRANPSISVEQVTDAGYFYLAFNLRRKPWNDVHRRRPDELRHDRVEGLHRGRLRHLHPRLAPHRHAGVVPERLLRQQERRRDQPGRLELRGLPQRPRGRAP